MLRHLPPALALPILLAVVAAAGPLARAQPGAADAGQDGVVTGTGVTTLTRQPNLLRMTMELSAEGKDVKEALAALKAEREALAAKLKQLGASGDAVKFDEPRVGGAAQNAQQQQLQRMILMRGGGRRPGAATRPAEGAPQRVSLTATVTAEWPLKAAGAEELLVSGHGLREKIRGAGLAKKPEKKLTPEEEEMMEEMEGMGMMDDDGSGGPKPGEPVFLFVSKVSAEDRAAATAEAFAKAREDAARTAAAAGTGLGRLRHLAAQVTPGAAGNNPYDEYQAYAYRQMLAMAGGRNRGGGADGGDEAIAAEPGPVTMQVLVTASFALK